MFILWRLHPGKENITQMYKVMLRKRASNLGWSGWRKRKRENIILPYLHVFQIIQNGGKYYIIVNNQSIINHEGIWWSTDKAAAENHKLRWEWDAPRKKFREHEKELFIWAFPYALGGFEFSSSSCSLPMLSSFYLLCLLNILEKFSFALNEYYPKAAQTGSKHLRNQKMCRFMSLRKCSISVFVYDFVSRSVLKSFKWKLKAEKMTESFITWNSKRLHRAIFSTLFPLKLLIVILISSARKHIITEA